MSTTPFPSPALICVGAAEETEHFTTQYLQKHFCQHAGPGPCRCTSCTLIGSGQSSSVTYVRPSGDYVLDDLQPLFSLGRFLLEENETRVFVICDAQRLSSACSNKLLKLIEEPPAGYIFIFLTSNYEALLPTIQSRCIVLHQASNDGPAKQGLLAFFLDEDKGEDATGFDAFLKNQQPSASEALHTVQQLGALIKYEAYAQPDATRDVIEKALANPPAPGGSVSYLRWIFMALHAARED